MRLLNQLRLNRLLSWTLMLAAVSFAGNGQVSAATNGPGMPNLADFTGGNTVQLVVSTPFNGNGLNAPVSRVKIYSTQQDVNISIYGFDHCNTGADNDSNTFDPTEFKVYSTNVSEGAPVQVGTTLTNQERCTYTLSNPRTFTVPVPNSVLKSTVPGHTNWYVFIFEARMTGTGVNGFRVRVNSSGSLIGYSNDATDKFAIQNRTGNGGNYESYNIPFGADCNVTSGSAILRWSDDDYNTGLQPASQRSQYYFQVSNKTTGAAVSMTGNGQNNVTRYYPDGGPNASQAVTLNGFNPKHKYEWQWRGVNDKNGIQFLLPWDSIASNVTCPQPPLVDGIKIDTAGNYQSVRAGVNAGTTYPFSDNTIVARTTSGAYVHGIDSNHYIFKKCPTGPAPYCGIANSAFDTELDPGSYKFEQAAGGTADGNYTYLGYTICDKTANPSTCTVAYLENQANMRAPTATITLQAGHVYNSRFIYKLSGAPNVTLTCTNPSANVFKLEGSAIDPDKSGALSLSYRQSTAPASSAQTASTQSNGVFSIDVSSQMSGAQSGRTFTVTAQGINSAGNPQGPDQSANADCNPPSGCPPGNSCQPSSCAGQNTTPSVTLPDAPVTGKSPYGLYGKSGYTRNAGEVYWQEIPDQMQITSAYDHYSGPTQLDTTTQQGWLPDGYQSGRTFTLYYNEYVNQYPYDDHNTTVQYEQKYQETKWYTSSTADGYTCPDSVDTGPTGNSGQNGHAKTCQHYYTGTADQWTCGSSPSGYPNSGGGGSSSSCYADYTLNGGAGASCSQWTQDSAGNWNCTGSWSCPDYSAYGWTTTGGPDGDNNCSYSYSGREWYSGTPSRWTCNGNFGGGSSSTCWYFHDGDPYYNWHSSAQTSPMPVFQGTYGGAPYLGECFPRSFTVQQPADSPKTDVQQVSFNDNENPSSVNISTQTGVKFTLEYGIKNLRHGMGVNGLSYQGDYYIEHADGSVEPLDTNDNQTQNVGGSVFTSGGTAQTNYSRSYAVSLPPLRVGDKVCAQFKITPGEGEMNQNGTQRPGSTSGEVNSTQIPNDPTCSAPVTNRPYARFYGNGVQAGSTFSTPESTCDPDAGIRAFSGGSGVRPRGSGTQFTAMSLGSIEEFASAFLRSAVPTSATGLSFANTGSSAYGGSFGGGCTKLPDYYGAKKPDDAAPTALSSLGSFPVGNASYSTPGGELSSQNIPAGSNVSVFVDGDVYISGNVVYGTSGWTFDPATRLTTVPSFYLVVRGDIYIAPNVTQLDGVYVAQPGPSGGGLIRTCAQPNGSAFLANTTDLSQDLYTNCNQQLTINGSFIAKEVRFSRAFSSIRHSVAGESPLSINAGAHGCNPGGSPSLNDCSAEIFNFSPETYINMPALKASTSAKKNSYDFITTLAPIL